MSIPYTNETLASVSRSTKMPSSYSHLPSNVRVISPFGSSSCGRLTSPFNVRRASGSSAASIGSSDTWMLMEAKSPHILETTSEFGQCEYMDKITKTICCEPIVAGKFCEDHQAMGETRSFRHKKHKRRSIVSIQTTICQDTHIDTDSSNTKIASFGDSVDSLPDSACSISRKTPLRPLRIPVITVC